MYFNNTGISIDTERPALYHLHLCFVTCRVGRTSGILTIFLTSVTPVALQYKTLAFGNNLFRKKLSHINYMYTNVSLQ